MLFYSCLFYLQLWTLALLWKGSVCSPQRSFIMFKSGRAGCVSFPLQEKHAVSPENVKHAESCNYCIHLHHSETWRGVAGCSKTACFDEYIRISIAHNQTFHQNKIVFNVSRISFDVCTADSILYLLLSAFTPQSFQTKWMGILFR